MSDETNRTISYLPASTTQEAFTINTAIWAKSGKRLRPTEATVRRYPIVAWRIETYATQQDRETSASPVLPGTWLEGGVLMEMPDNRVIETVYDGREWDNLNQAKADLLLAAQKEWDRTQATAE